MTRHDVCVRGAGVVGRALALSLARLGLRVALVPAAPPGGGRAVARPDVRAYALNPASVALLRRLKVWDALPAQAATAVHDMRVEGDDGAAIGFSAWQARVGELAWIVDAPRLEAALASAVSFSPHVEVLPAERPDAPAAPVDAALTALCEGRDSPTRRALGIALRVHPYGQTALAARLVAERPHANTARQWFRAPDVLALLPLDLPEPGRSYALVWSMPDAQAQALDPLDAAAFEARLAEATGGACGRLALASERAGWPLVLAEAQTWSRPGFVLLGDAAHVVHPLAGQGLNLGLADVAALASVIEQREPWRRLGDAKLLRRYARERAAPTWAMSRVTDGLLQLYASDQPLLREARNRGLAVVDNLPPLKRWLTSRALG